MNAPLLKMLNYTRENAPGLKMLNYTREIIREKWWNNVEGTCAENDVMTVDRQQLKEYIFWTYNLVVTGWMP